MRLRSFLLVAMLSAAGCSFRQTESASADIIRIKGSDSMLLLVQRLAEGYMQRHAGVSIVAEGGGSGAGIRALTDNTVELCASSRPLSSEEVSELARRHRTLGVGILCAKDALDIVLHPSNPVDTLSLQQIADIFTGTVTNWKQVGGGDRPIHVYTREANSGTYLYFEDHVLLGADYSGEAITVPGARALIDAVAQDSAGIGYSTPVYAGRLRATAVNGIRPSSESVRNGTYPISRYLYLYSLHQPAGEVKRFLDWVTGPEGQSVAAASGYTPLYTTVQ